MKLISLALFLSTTLIGIDTRAEDTFSEPPEVESRTEAPPKRSAEDIAEGAWVSPALLDAINGRHMFARGMFPSAPRTLPEGETRRGEPPRGHPMRSGKEASSCWGFTVIPKRVSWGREVAGIVSASIPIPGTNHCVIFAQTATGRYRHKGSTGFGIVFEWDSLPFD